MLHQHGQSLFQLWMTSCDDARADLHKSVIIYYYYYYYSLGHFALEKGRHVTDRHTDGRGATRNAASYGTTAQ